MRYTPFSTLLLIFFTIALNSSVSATTFDFTGYSGSNLGNSIQISSQNNAITATISSNNEGVSAFRLDGLGVAGDRYRSIQGNESLYIQFDQAINIETLHLRQWEGPDDAIVTLHTWEGKSSSLLVNEDNGGPFNTNEYIALNAIGITSIELLGIHNGEILGIPATQFFTAGLLGVEISQVPIPATAWLFAFALLSLTSARHRRQ